MPLSIEERGMLDKQIDDTIEKANNVVDQFRVLKNKFHFKEENDAAFGFILGVITATFNQWLLNQLKEVSEDTLIEIKKSHISQESRNT